MPKLNRKSCSKFHRRTDYKFLRKQKRQKNTKFKKLHVKAELVVRWRQGRVPQLENAARASTETQ